MPPENRSFGGVLIQKQKQSEEELVRKVQDLQAELASSNELREKLERKVCEFLRTANFTVMYLYRFSLGTSEAFLHIVGFVWLLRKSTRRNFSLTDFNTSLKLRFSLSGYQMM